MKRTLIRLGLIGVGAVGEAALGLIGVGAVGDAAFGLIGVGAVGDAKAAADRRVTVEAKARVRMARVNMRCPYGMAVIVTKDSGCLERCRKDSV